MASKTEHHKRSPCPVACGLDIIGDHWTLLVVRDMLFLGRHEYGQMLEAPEGISSNILSDRLSKLQKQGLVGQITHPENRKKKLYYLTAKGKGLIHVLMAITSWSKQYMGSQVKLPTDLLAEMNRGPDHFIEQTLERLKQWEVQYQIHS